MSSLGINSLYVWCQSAPFKAASKRSLAEKARELGLEETANKIIQCQISNEQHVISQHVDAKTAGARQFNLMIYMNVSDQDSIEAIN